MARPRRAESELQAGLVFGNKASYDRKLGLLDFLEMVLRFRAILAGTEMRFRLLDHVLDFRFFDPLGKKIGHGLHRLESITLAAALR